MKAIRSVYLLFFFCLSSIIKTRIEAFTCDNGKTIVDNYFCDTDPRDCGDGSDEAFGCNRNKCGKGKFVCTENQLCQPISVRCNGYRDCSDGSDEMHCGDSAAYGAFIRYREIFLRKKKCSVSNEKYLCQDELKCIDLQEMCDGQCDCSNCSDENSFNCYNYNDSCRSCSHHCLLTPNGAECICSPSSNGTSVNWWCEKLVNCTGDNSCDQSCMRYNSSTTSWCSCFENYSAIPGTRGRECQTDVRFENLLVYSTVLKIKALNVTSDYVRSIIEHGEVNVTALTAARNYIYYSSFQGGKASISKITNASEEYHNVIETDSLITSLAVDWITENIYFINNACVCVCTNSGNICVRLECNDANNVVLAPKFRWMYYTKKSPTQDEKIIVKSNMDGSEKTTFMDGSYHHLMSLSIDEIRETLYWFELNTMTLYSTSFQGGNRIERSMKQQYFTLSFTVFDKMVFFLKSQYRHDNTIYSSRNWSDFRYYTDLETNHIQHLYIYNPILQNITKFANPCATASCSGLCLLRPSSTTNRSNYTCLCQNHTSKNGTPWCSRPSIQPTPDVESIPKTEITLVTEQFSILTTGREVETTTMRLKNSSPNSHTANTPADIPSNFINITTTKLLQNSSSTNELLSSSIVPSPQASNSDGLLFGFMLGVALILVIVGLYAIFRRVYWNRRHQQMSVSELMTLQ